MLLVFDTHPVA